MRKTGSGPYSRDLALGVIGAGGSLGTMIPPSIVLIFYSLAANVSVGDLFLASILPGLLLAALYCFYIVVRCHLRPEIAPLPPAGERTRLSLISVLKGFTVPFFVVLVVLGSIYGGLASISEAATLGTAVTILGVLARGEFSIIIFNISLQRTLVTCGMLIWLTLCATAFVSLYNLVGGIGMVRSLFTDLSFHPTIIIVIMVFVFFILGMFIDWLGILMLTIPIFVPVVVKLGFDPVWFGVVFCMSMQVSYLSPPFGWAAFFLKGVAPEGISLGMIFRSFVPFVFLQILGIALVIYFPGIALWLTGR